MRTRTYPTHYSSGPFRLIRLSHRGGYMIADGRHTGPRTRYAITAPHPTSGRPVPARLPLLEALGRLDELAADL